MAWLLHGEDFYAKVNWPNEDKFSGVDISSKTWIYYGEDLNEATELIVQYQNEYKKKYSYADGSYQCIEFNLKSVSQIPDDVDKETLNILKVYEISRNNINLMKQS